MPEALKPFIQVKPNDRTWRLCTCCGAAAEFVVEVGNTHDQGGATQAIALCRADLEWLHQAIRSAVLATTPSR